MSGDGPTGTSRVDSVRGGMAVTEYRPPTGWDRTLVMLSSLGLSRRGWDVVAPELARTDRVLALDLPGHGTSPAPEHFLTIPDLAEQIALLLDEQGPGDVVVVGNSMGATVGTALADLRPDLVSRLVHVGSAIWETEHQRRDWLHSRSRLLCGPEGGREMSVEFVTAVFGRYDATWHQMLAEDQQRAGPRLGWAMWALYAYDVTAALSRLDQPVLAVFGDRDPYRESSLPALRRHVTRFDEVVVPGGSHLLPLDRPAELAAHVREWLGAGAGRPTDINTIITEEMA